MIEFQGVFGSFAPFNILDQSNMIKTCLKQERRPHVRSLCFLGQGERWIVNNLVLFTAIVR